MDNPAPEKHVVVCGDIFRSDPGRLRRSSLGVQRKVRWTFGEGIVCRGLRDLKSKLDPDSRKDLKLGGSLLNAQKLRSV